MSKLSLSLTLCLIVATVGCKTRITADNCGTPDERVACIFNKLKYKAKMAKPISICSEPETKKGDNIIFYLGAWAEKNSSNDVSIKIGRGYARIFSDQALSYILAHELGHVILKHLQNAIVRDGRIDSEQEKIFQKDADDFAIKLVGEQAYKTFLIENQQFK